MQAQHGHLVVSSQLNYRALHCSHYSRSKMHKLFSSCSKIIRTWFRAGNLSHIAKYPFWKSLVLVCIFSFWLVDNYFKWMLIFFISIIFPTFYFSCSQVVSWSGHRVVINFKKAFYFFRTTFTFILFCWFGYHLLIFLFDQLLVEAFSEIMWGGGCYLLWIEVFCIATRDDNQ